MEVLGVAEGVGLGLHHPNLDNRHFGELLAV